jgi:eukaryotic-like serine/threonine-protein kinase
VSIGGANDQLDLEDGSIAQPRTRRAAKGRDVLCGVPELPYLRTSMTVTEARLRQVRDLLARTTIEGAFGVQYFLQDVLGEGGQGWVYRACYDEPEGPWVVVKVLRPDVVNEEALSRFLREADVLRKLGQAQAPCPSVVRFYDHGIVRHAMPDGETYSLPFTVLEYVHGTNLADILSKAGGRGLPVGRARRLMRQVARALMTIHAAQIVHRDLKPSNLLVANEAGQEVAKVTDFGLVKRFDIDIKGTVALAGASIGYAPPEQFEMGNKRVSPRTDVFSFGAVLFETLTSRPAFPVNVGESPFQALSRVLSGPRPQLAAHMDALSSDLSERPDLVASLDRELARATSADPSERQGSIRELWDTVEPLLRAASERPLGGTAKIPARPEGSIAPRPVEDTRASGALAADVAAGQVSAMARRSGPEPAVKTSTPAPVVRVVSSSPLPERARSVTITPDGKCIHALGRYGVFRLEGTAWVRVPFQGGLDLATLKGVLATPAGEVVLYGDRGAVIGMAADGSTHPWAPFDFEIAWTSATLHPAEILLLGEHLGKRAAVLGVLRPGQPLAKRLLEGVGRLHSVARLSTGALLACGEGGELVHLLGAAAPAPVRWGRTGHLLAVAAGIEGTAHVVGTGGHALLVTANLDAKLEPVQTTRDLLNVIVAPNGVPWAGGADARLVRRTQTGWMRVTLPSGMNGCVKAVHATATTVTAVLDDGVVVEGTIG